MKKRYIQLLTLLSFCFVLFSCKKETETPVKLSKITNYRIENKVVVNNIIKSIVVDKSGNKWFGTDGGGISKFDGTSWTHYSKTDGLLSNYVHTLTIDVNGNVWAGYGFNEGGVTKFNGQSWQKHTHPDGPGNGVVLSIAGDSKGNLYFGTLGGVSMYDAQGWAIYFYYPEGGPSVGSMAIDKAGNTWLGLGNISGQIGGLIKYDKTIPTKYTSNDGLASNAVTCVAIDSKDNKWIGTEGSGISKFDGANWVTYKIADGLVNNNINTIIIDSQDNVWIGTNGGVSKFDGKSWTTYNASNGLINDIVLSIAIDKNGNKWIGTSDGISLLED